MIEAGKSELVELASRLETVRQKSVLAAILRWNFFFSFVLKTVDSNNQKKIKKILKGGFPWRSSG